MSDTETFDPSEVGHLASLQCSDGDVVAHRWAAASMPAPQRANQDAWSADTGVWAVADGMGGLDHGAQASTFVVRRFVALAPLRRGEQLCDFVKTLSNEVIDRLGSNVGSTLVGGVLRGSSLDIVHVGDSRVFCHRDGALELVSRDHTVRELALEVGTDPSGLSEQKEQGLTSYIGQPHQTITVGLRSLNVSAGDRLLFVTDGVYRSVQFDEMQALVEAVPADELPELLIAKAHARRHVDDATALVVEVLDS